MATETKMKMNAMSRNDKIQLLCGLCGCGCVQNENCGMRECCKHINITATEEADGDKREIHPEEMHQKIYGIRLGDREPSNIRATCAHY